MHAEGEIESLTYLPTERLGGGLYDRKAFEVAEIASYSPVERREYEESLKVYRDLINVVNTASRKVQKKGEERGVKQGLKQGKEIGRQEAMEKVVR